MLTKTVESASLTNNVARLTLADVIGVEAGYKIRVAGIDTTFNGHHTITSVDVDDSWIQYAKNHANILEVDVTGIAEVIVEWIDDQDVIKFIGVEPATESDEDYLAFCVEAANGWVFERRRKSGYSDLPNAIPSSEVKLGTILYAGSLYRERGSVDSFASFQDMPTVAPVGTMGQILRLIGCNRPRVY